MTAMAINTHKKFFKFIKKQFGNKLPKIHMYTDHLVIITSMIETLFQGIFTSLISFWYIYYYHTLKLKQVTQRPKSIQCTKLKEKVDVFKLPWHNSCLR